MRVHQPRPVAEASFAADPSCVAEARGFVRRELRARDLTAGEDDACLVVSELATMSVLAGKSFTVRLIPLVGRLRVEVSDPDRGGRRTQLVARVAASWGVGQLGSGPAVWAEISAG